MFMHFTFADGSNPYIATTTKAFLFMLMHYEVKQTEARDFLVTSDKQKAHPKGYRPTQEAIREIAVDWSWSGAEFEYSYQDLIEWQEFFHEYGKKYGLLREFKENGIC